MGFRSGLACGAGVPCKCNETDGIDEPDVSQVIVEDHPQRRHFGKKKKKNRAG
jgi:hypothetical protein